jgi:hypothetical protein
MLVAEDLAHSALRQIGESSMPGSRPTFARMAGQKGASSTTHVDSQDPLGFLAGQRHKPRLGLGCDRRLLTWPWTVIHRLMMHPQGSTNGNAGRASRYAKSMRARATRLAGSVRNRVIAISFVSLVQNPAQLIGFMESVH